MADEIASLKKVIRDCGFNINDSNIRIVVEHSRNEIRDLNERAMFYAHLIHETAGLNVLEEGRATRDLYGPNFHGRGFIHLTHEDNYRAASQGLGYGNKFVDNPDLVAQPKYAIETAIWFWETQVRRSGSFRTFDQTTLAINGGYEANLNGAQPQARYNYYQRVARELDRKSVV